MKRACIITLILVFALSIPAFAKPLKKNIKKGDLVVGGGFDSRFGIGLEMENTDDGDLETNKIDFGLNGFFGFFVADGFELGPFAGVDYHREVDRDREITDATGDFETYEIIYTETMYDIGLQLGYFFETNTLAVPYLQLFAAYVGGTEAVDNEVDDMNVNISAFRIGPRTGVNFFFTPTVALDLGIFFDYTTGTRSYDFTEAETNLVNPYVASTGEDTVDNSFYDLEYGAAIGLNLFF